MIDGKNSLSFSFPLFFSRNNLRPNILIFLMLSRRTLQPLKLFWQFRQTLFCIECILIFEISGLFMCVNKGIFAEARFGISVWASSIDKQRA